MPKLQPRKEIVISSSPYSETIPLLRSQLGVTDSSDILKDTPAPIDDYIISGTHILTGAVSINPASGAVKDMQVRFIFRALLSTDVLGGKGFTVFGYRFLDYQANKKAELLCYYNGTSWEVTYIPDFEESGILPERAFQNESIPEAAFKSTSVPERAFKDGSIPTRAFKARSIGAGILGENSVGGNELVERGIPSNKLGQHVVTNTELGLMTPGAVKVGDDSWLPVDENMNEPGTGKGNVLVSQGYGKRPKAKQVTHQGTITEDGLFYINPSAVTRQNMGTYSVGPENADDTMVSELIPVEVDFADASRNRVRTAFKGAMWAVWGSVEKNIVGNGTITIKDDDDVVIGVIDVNDGDAKDVTGYSVTIASGFFDKFDTLKFECAGSSAGKVKLSAMCVKRV